MVGRKEIVESVKAVFDDESMKESYHTDKFCIFWLNGDVFLCIYEPRMWFVVRDHQSAIKLIDMHETRPSLNFDPVQIRCLSMHVTRHGSGFAIYIVGMFWFATRDDAASRWAFNVFLESEIRR